MNALLAPIVMPIVDFSFPLRNNHFLSAMIKILFTGGNIDAPINLNLNDAYPENKFYSQKSYYIFAPTAYFKEAYESITKAK